jgi:phosphoribosylformylglycinamidine synthase
MVGLLEDVSRSIPLGFVPDSRIVLLGEPPQTSADGFPRLDLDAERRLGRLLRALAAEQLLRSAQDISDGGLAVALAECCFVHQIGAHIEVDGDVALYSEDQGRAIVSCGAQQLERVLALASQHGVPAEAIGSTGGERLILGTSINVNVNELNAIWEGGLA